jgi:hypothetical protein
LCFEARSGVDDGDAAMVEEAARAFADDSFL